MCALGCLRLGVCAWVCALGCVRLRFVRLVVVICAWFVSLFAFLQEKRKPFLDSIRRAIKALATTSDEWKHFLNGQCDAIYKVLMNVRVPALLFVCFS